LAEKKLAEEQIKQYKLQSEEMILKHKDLQSQILVLEKESEILKYNHAKMEEEHGNQISKFQHESNLIRIQLEQEMEIFKQENQNLQNELT